MFDYNANTVYHRSYNTATEILNKAIFEEQEKQNFKQAIMYYECAQSRFLDCKNLAKMYSETTNERYAQEEIDKCQQGINGILNKTRKKEVKKEDSFCKPKKKNNETTYFFD